MHVAKRKITVSASLLLLLFITLILPTQQILELLRKKTKLDGFFWNDHEPGKSRIENTHLRVQVNIMEVYSLLQTFTLG